MELLGDTLSYHQSSSAEVSQNSQIHHKIAFTGTAIFTVKLLQCVLPPEKVCKLLAKPLLNSYYTMSVHLV